MVDNTGSEDPKNKKYAEGLFKTVKGIASKFSLLVKGDSKSLKEARRQTRELSIQAKLTKKSIKENRFRFDKIAESNANVAEALSNYDKVNFDVIENVEQLIAQNKEVPAELGKVYKESMLQLNDSLKPLGMQKDMVLSLGSSMDELAKIVADKTVDADTKKSFTSDFIKLMEKQQNLSVEQKQVLQILVDEAKKGLVFSDQQTEDLGAIFELFKANKIDELKMTGTINEISHVAGKLLMSSRNIEDKMDQGQFSIKDLLDKLEKGLNSDSMDLGDLLFAAMGIPGLLKGVKSVAGFGSRVLKSIKDIFGADGFISKSFEKTSKGIKTFFSKDNQILKFFSKDGAVGKAFAKVSKFGTRVGNAAKSITGGFSKIGKFLSPVVKVVKSVGGMFKSIGKVAKPIMGALKIAGIVGGGAAAATIGGPILAVIGAIGAIISLFEIFDGWFDAANISGKTEEAVTIGDRVQSALSAAIAGLSFGFISTEEVFKKIDEAWGTVGEIFDDTGKIFDDFVDTIVEFFMGDDGFMGGIKNIISKVKDFKLSSVMPSWLTSAISGPTPDNSEDTRFNNAPTRTQAVVPSMRSNANLSSNDAMASAESNRALSREETVKNNSRASAMAKIIPMPTSQPQQPQSKPATRSNQIDDMQLSALNLSLMD